MMLSTVMDVVRIEVPDANVTVALNLDAASAFIHIAGATSHQWTEMHRGVSRSC